MFTVSSLLLHLPSSSAKNILKAADETPAKKEEAQQTLAEIEQKLQWATDFQVDQIVNLLRTRPRKPSDRSPAETFIVNQVTGRGPALVSRRRLQDILELCMLCLYFSSSLICAENRGGMENFGGADGGRPAAPTTGIQGCIFEEPKE